MGIEICIYPLPRNKVQNAQTHSVAWGWWFEMLCNILTLHCKALQNIRGIRAFAKHYNISCALSS